jgi:hypothetical protein
MLLENLEVEAEKQIRGWGRRVEQVYFIVLEWGAGGRSRSATEATYSTYKEPETARPPTTRHSDTYGVRKAIRITTRPSEN